MGVRYFWVETNNLLAPVTPPAYARMVGGGLLTASRRNKPTQLSSVSPLGIPDRNVLIASRGSNPYVS